MITNYIHKTKMPSKQYRQALVTTYTDDEPAYCPILFNYMNFQRECCPTTGRLHWQIYIQCNKKTVLSTLKTHFGNQAHVKNVVIDNGASEYCHKEETAIPDTYKEFGIKRGKGGPKEITFDDIQECESWIDVLKIPQIHARLQWAREVWNAKIPQITLPDTLLEWQSNAIEKLKIQDDRKVDVYVDTVGGHGKSVLAKWLIFHYGAFLCTGGKHGDIIHAFQGQEIVVFDLARAIDENYWPYQAMECFKNGVGFSGKYASTTKFFKPCKVIIFTNQEPDRSKLSADRWDVTYLSEIAQIPNDRGAADLDVVRTFSDD